MKKYPLIYWFMFATLLAANGLWAQETNSKTTRIHLYSSVVSKRFELLPVPEGSNPIRITPRTYMLIETAYDSLGFVVRKGGQTQTMYVPLERGKDYYLRITRSFTHDETFILPAIVDEINEREFKWMLLMNESNLTPQKSIAF
jgi:hypothetical protein